MRELKLVYATRMSVAFALAASVLSLPASEIAARTGDAGDAVAGPARVIDGDTLSIGDVRIRLEGIDAPEAGQTCKSRSGVSWPCGSAATAALERLIAGWPVRCVGIATGRPPNTSAKRTTGTPSIRAARPAST